MVVQRSSRGERSPVDACRTRSAVHRDLRAVAAIERAVFPDPWSHGMFVAHLRYGPPEMFLIADDVAGHVLGYALTRVVQDEAELLNIAVSPTMRRRGVGAALLRGAMSICRSHGAEWMYLEVREGNPAARALYERYGFEAVGRRAGYYHSPREDAIVMRAPLAGVLRDGGAPDLLDGLAPSSGTE